MIIILTLEFLLLIISFIGFVYSLITLGQARDDKKNLRGNGQGLRLAEFNIATEYNRLVALGSLSLIAIFTMLDTYLEGPPRFGIFGVILFYIQAISIVVNSYKSSTIRNVIREVDKGSEKGRRKTDKIDM